MSFQTLFVVVVAGALIVIIAVGFFSRSSKKNRAKVEKDTGGIDQYAAEINDPAVKK